MQLFRYTFLFKTFYLNRFVFLYLKKWGTERTQLYNCFFSNNNNSKKQLSARARAARGRGSAYQPGGRAPRGVCHRLARVDWFLLNS